MTQCGVLSHWVVTDDSMRSPVTLGRDRSSTRSSATLASDRNLTRGSVTLAQDRNSTQSSVTRSHDIVGRRSYVTLFHKNTGRRSYVTLFRKNTGRRSYDIRFHKKYKNENIIFISRQILFCLKLAPVKTLHEPIVNEVGSHVMTSCKKNGVSRRPENIWAACCIKTIDVQSRQSVLVCRLY